MLMTDEGTSRRYASIWICWVVDCGAQSWNEATAYGVVVRDLVRVAVG